MIRRIARSPFARDMADHIRAELPAACWAVLTTAIAFALINIGVEIGLALGNGGVR